MIKTDVVKIAKLDELDPQQYYENIIKLIGKRKITNGYEKQTSKEEPDNIIEYLEDWTGRMIQDGHPIQIFFQVLFQNCQKQEEKQWLERFLSHKKVSLLKLNLKPRQLIPKIYIQKDESEIKEMVKQIYPWASNEHGLNFIMKSNYKWRNLSWRQIELQLKRNRYKCKLLNINICSDIEQNKKEGTNNSIYSSESGQKIIKQQIGLLFTNLIMLSNIGLYGDSIYMLIYEGLFNQRDQNDKDRQQGTKMNVVIGFVLTQYLLPVIVFHGLIQNHMDNDFQQYLHTIVTTTIMDWCRGNNYALPFYFIFYHSTKTENYDSRSSNTWVLKLNCNESVYITSIHIGKEQINGSSSQPCIYAGPISPFKKNNFLQIFYRLHSSVCDRKDIDIHTLIEKINDRCRLITILIKIGLILQRQSVSKRESAMQLLLGSASDERSMRAQSWELQQLMKLRQIIYSKQILKIVRDIIKDATNYEISRRVACIRDKKNVKIQLFTIQNSSECISLNFSLQNHRWECQCRYIYKSGLPCSHIVRVLHQFKGDISYYISERWKNPHPQENNRKKQGRIKNKEGVPVTTNKGLARLVNLYRSFYNQQIL